MTGISFFRMSVGKVSSSQDLLLSELMTFEYFRLCLGTRSCVVLYGGVGSSTLLNINILFSKKVANSLAHLYVWARVVPPVVCEIIYKLVQFPRVITVLINFGLDDALFLSIKSVAV